MKSPGWSVLVVALLLGVVTGDCVLSTQGNVSKREVTIVKQPPSGSQWQDTIAPYTR